MKIIVTPFAKSQVKSIHDYYKNAGFVPYAKSVSEEFLHVVKLLGTQKQHGQVEETIEIPNLIYRYSLVKKHFKVIYRIEKKTIYVTDFFDTRQSPSKIKRNT